MCTVKDRIKGEDENNGFQTLVKPATWENNLASLLLPISSLEAFQKKKKKQTCKFLSNHLFHF